MNFNQRTFEQAVTWFVALQSQDCDEQQRSEFQQWLAQHKSHTAAYAEAEKLWINLDSVKSVPIPNLKARNQRWNAARTGIATLVFAAISTGWWLDYSAETVTHSTGIGQRRSIELADGSQIELNAATQLSVRLSWLRREIKLQEGEAMFDVTHEKFRTFTVQAGTLQVRDIGTRFNVRKRQDGTVVSVLEGEVEVKPEHAWLGQNVKAGFSCKMDEDGHLHASELANLEQASGWLDGRLIFNHTPLSHVVAELERYHDLHFVFADSTLANETLSGSFETTDLNPFLRAVEKILSVRTQRQKQTIVLSRR
ncbi:MAG: FecR family protein [Methylococcales bacterium]|nr:FecR family protein [Methylococcales bacterium]MDD5755560.1 FecR family protein [Methylococcales bacterium]